MHRPRIGDDPAAGSRPPSETLRGTHGPRQNRTAARRTMLFAGPSPSASRQLPVSPHPILEPMPERPFDGLQSPAAGPAFGRLVSGGAAGETTFTGAAQQRAPHRQRDAAGAAPGSHHPNVTGRAGYRIAGGRTPGRSLAGGEAIA